MDTGEKIILAALRQFETHGFSAATTKSIAAEAGVAEVTLFRYFGDKKSLFLRVAAYIAGEFGVMEIPKRTTGDLVEDAYRLCLGMLKNFIHYNALFRMLIFEAKKHGDIHQILVEIRGRALENIRLLVGGDTGLSDGAQMRGCVEWLGNSLMGTSICYCMFHGAEDEDAFIGAHARIIADGFAYMIQETAGK